VAVVSHSNSDFVFKIEVILKSGLSFCIFEKNSSNQKLKQSKTQGRPILKHIFQKLNISEKCWYSYEATVTPQK